MTRMVYHIDCHTYPPCVRICRERERELESREQRGVVGGEGWLGGRGTGATDGGGRTVRWATMSR